MIILGIDPGSHRTGFGVIEVQGSRFRPIDAGTIKCPKGDDLPTRLRLIHEALLDVIKEHGPDVASIEDVFNARNPRSSLILGQARGAAMLAASLSDITVAEYAPREVKMALTGNGAASKDQVGFMVQRLLGLSKPPESSDASDALGLALCHAMRQGSPTAAFRQKGKGA